MGTFFLSCHNSDRVQLDAILANLRIFLDILLSQCNEKSRKVTVTPELWLKNMHETKHGVSTSVHCIGERSAIVCVSFCLMALAHPSLFIWLNLAPKVAGCIINVMGLSGAQILLLYGKKILRPQLEFNAFHCVNVQRLQCATTLEFEISFALSFVLCTTYKKVADHLLCTIPCSRVQSALTKKREGGTV